MLIALALAVPMQMNADSLSDYKLCEDGPISGYGTYQLAHNSAKAVRQKTQNDYNDGRVTVAGIIYAVNSEKKEAVVTCDNWGYEGVPDVIIPETVSYNGEDYAVVEIDQNAFSGANITSCIIPNSVTMLNYEIFNRCSNLKRVTIGSGVTALAESMFKGCYNLEEIIISAESTYLKNVDGAVYDYDLTKCYYWPLNNTKFSFPSTVVELCDGLFNGNVNVVELTIPEGIEKLDYLSFSGCQNLTTVHLPSTLISIGDGAFRSNEKLKDINLPEGLEEIGPSAFNNTALETVSLNAAYIGDSAFGECHNLTSVYVGPDVEIICSGPINGGWFYVGYNIWRGCENLQSIDVSEDNKNFCSEDGVLYSKTKHALLAVPSAKSEVAISPKTGQITAYAFNGCKNIKSLVLPSNIGQVDDGAFAYCEGLKTLTFSPGTDRICNTALRGCNSLSDFYYQNGTPNSAFQDRELIEYAPSGMNLHVPSGSKALFEDCKSVKDIDQNINVVADQAKPNVVVLDYSLGYTECGSLYGGGACEAAILYPKEELAKYKGCKITSVRANLHLSYGAYAFVDTREDDGCERVAYTNNNGFIFGGGQTINFDEPYEITGDKDLIIGFGAPNGGLFMWSSAEAPTNRNLFKYGTGDDLDWVIFNGNAWEIGFSVEGDIPDAIRLRGELEALQNDDEITISGNVENISVEPVTSYDVEYSFENEDGEKYGDTQSVTIEGQFDARVLNPFTISVAKPDKTNKYKAAVRIAKVNGQAIDEDISAESESFLAINEHVNRKVVVEEGTGTWCSFCPRGIVGLAAMKEAHPDNFIAIAVHDDSDMYPENYTEMINRYFYALPMCTMNRKYLFDPNAEDLEKYYKREINSAIASIDMSAEWANEEKTEIAISTDTKFIYDNDSHYGIAYVVIENAVGPYYQYNGYSGGSEMGGFEALPQYTPVVFSDVARSILGSWQGLVGSVPSDIVCDEVYKYKYTISLPNNIDNVENTQYIALLIDRVSEEILNADIIDYSDIEDYDPSSVRSVEVSNKINPVALGDGAIGNLPANELVTVYNAQGQIILKQAVDNSGQISLRNAVNSIVIVKCDNATAKLVVR
jgi:hypothetical protein